MAFGCEGFNQVKLIKKLNSNVILTVDNRWDIQTRWCRVLDLMMLKCFSWKITPVNLFLEPYLVPVSRFKTVLLTTPGDVGSQSKWCKTFLLGNNLHKFIYSFKFGPSHEIEEIASCTTRWGPVSTLIMSKYSSPEIINYKFNTELTIQQFNFSLWLWTRIFTGCQVNFSSMQNLILFRTHLANFSKKFCHQNFW